MRENTGDANFSLLKYTYKPLEFKMRVEWNV